MLWFYTIAWWLALPLVLLRLWWRGRKEPGYRQHLAERFGFYGEASKPMQPCIWLHAVSVGETRAAEPLIDALFAHYPNHAILLTHMTPTGRATGKALFARHSPRIVQAYLPYDTGSMVRRLMTHFKPSLCILMETEVWPNLIAQSARQGIPVALVNARLSSRSLAKAQRLSWLMQDAARAITCVAAQTEADATRLRQFGAPNVHVTGSIKFDVTPPQAALAAGALLRRQIGARPVLLCASTRDGEEALIMDALASLALPDVLLLIVPRHPQRFGEVAQMAAARGLALRRRSELLSEPAETSVAPATRVLLGDSMGEMFAYYAACDLAFIGGSLLPLGGQNLIEACALGKPVLIGPHTFNFGVVSEDAIAAGAALRVADANALMQQASHLLSDNGLCATMGQQARAFALQHRGATGRTLALLEPFLQGRQATK